MSILFTLFTALGPILGGIGLYSGFQFLFWLGVVLAVINLILNVASGAMNFPILPAIFALAGCFVWPIWYVGLGAGLLVWTAIEAFGELVPLPFLKGRSR